MGLARRMRILSYVALALALGALALVITSEPRAAATAARCENGPKFCEFGDMMITALGQALVIPAATMAAAAWWIQHRAERGERIPKLRHAAIACAILLATWFVVTALDAREFEQAYAACELPGGTHDWSCIDQETPLSDLYLAIAVIAQVAAWMVGILALVHWRGPDRAANA